MAAWLPACAARARTSEQVSCNRQRERHGGVRYDDGRKQLIWEEEQLHGEKFEILEAEQTKIDM